VVAVAASLWTAVSAPREASTRRKPCKPNES
jgi:hypothetical protein